MSATSTRMRSALARKVSDEREIWVARAGIDEPHMISYFSITWARALTPEEQTIFDLGRAKSDKSSAPTNAGDDIFKPSQRFDQMARCRGIAVGARS
jgi:hypothetical protein